MINKQKIDIIKKSRPIRLLDIIVISLCLILTILLMIFSYKDKGINVEIVNNGITSIYPLNKDNVITLDHLIIHIENSYVYVSDSDCDDHICEKTGKINKVNQMIVCLPNNIVIKIIGDSDYQAETGQSR